MLAKSWVPGQLQYFFTENWIPRETEEFLSIQRELVAKPRWIIDGNATKSLLMRAHEADLILYFNYPLWLCYYRVFKRLFTKDSAIEDRAQGCSEIISLSLLRYIYSFPQRVAQFTHHVRTNHPNTPFAVIKNNVQLTLLKKQLSSLSVPTTK